MLRPEAASPHIWDPGAGQLDPGADDDLVALGAQSHGPPCVRRSSGVARAGPSSWAARLRQDGFSPLGRGAVRLDHIAFVVETSPEQVDQERPRVAMKHPADLHGLPSPQVVVADGEDTLRSAAPAARVTAGLSLMLARRRVAAEGQRGGGGTETCKGGGRRRVVIRGDGRGRSRGVRRSVAAPPAVAMMAYRGTLQPQTGYLTANL